MQRLKKKRKKERNEYKEKTLWYWFEWWTNYVEKKNLNSM